MLLHLDIHSQKKNIKLDINFVPYIKINSKRIIDINIKCKTINLLEENIGENLWDLGIGEVFLDLT